MAKYVCDFDVVYSIGDKVCNTVSEMENSLGNYSSKIDSDLGSWEGIAQKSFLKTKGSQVDLAKKDYTYIKELGEFIKQSSRNIQDLDEQLSNISI